MDHQIRHDLDFLFDSRVVVHIGGADDLAGESVNALTSPLVDLNHQMGYADFCMAPTQNTLYVVGLENPQHTLDTIEYYTSCTGKNPFDNKLSQSPSPSLPFLIHLLQSMPSTQQQKLIKKSTFSSRLSVPTYLTCKISAIQSL
jgi:hypothetical protein